MIRLTIIKSLARALKTIRKDISEIKKINELVEYIPMKYVELVAYWLLVIWILSPIYIMLRSLLLESHREFDLYLNQFILGTEWFMLLQQIGYLGILLGFLIFLKGLIISKDKNEKKSYKYFIENLFPTLLFLMLIWSILSWCFSDNHLLSFYGGSYRKDGLLSYFTYAGIFSCGYIIRNNHYIKNILIQFTSISTLLSCLVLVNNNTINRLLTLQPNSAVFNNTNHFAYYLCLSIMCAVALIIIEKGSSITLFFRVSSLGILTAALVKNGSFGPYLAIVVGFTFLLFLIYLFDPSSFKRLMLAISTFLFISVIMNIHSNFFINEILKLFGDIDDIVTKTKDASRAGSGRWKLWVNGVRFSLEKPFFGYGPDNLGNKYLEAGISIDRPHNEIIQFAASLGIPAALLYISAMLNLFKNLITNRKQLTTIIICMFSVVFAYLVSSIFGNTMYYTTPFFFMILGLCGGMKAVLNLNRRNHK